MVKIYLILLFAVSVCSRVFAQEDVQGQDTLEVKAKLITNLDSVLLPPYCGMVAWNLTFEFELTEVLKGTYPAKQIRINIMCPREAVEHKWLVMGQENQFRLVKRVGFKELHAGGEIVEQELDDYKVVY